ncbi:hypothetical protein KC345_g263 [Hortaea werneckii]|nr:hypothetical protein KC345_g263 [Hortaea werneckii]
MPARRRDLECCSTYERNDDLQPNIESLSRLIMVWMHGTTVVLLPARLHPREGRITEVRCTKPRRPSVRIRLSASSVSALGVSQPSSPVGRENGASPRYRT